MAALRDGSESEVPMLALVRRVAPWLALALVGVLILNYYSGYKRNLATWEAAQKKPAASKTTTSTPVKKTDAKTSSGGQAPSGKLVKVVVVSAVTLRKDPSSTAKAIRDLSKGDELTLVGQVGSWYKVTDAKGVLGWVTTSEKYTKLSK